MEFKTDVLLHGGDYNPDQWLDRPDILERDAEMLAESGCNVVSLGIFAWSTLEPEEGVFRLDWMEQVIDRLTAVCKDNHIRRLQKGACTIEGGFVLSDLLNNYERVSDHCSNVAVAIIEVEHNSFDTHKYLNGVKYGNSTFNEIYDAYSEKYVL